MSLRPIDLARAAGISAQQVRRYEAMAIIPAATRTASGHRRYTEGHVESLVAARSVLAGFGWQEGVRALHHLSNGRVERAFAVADRAHLELHEARRRTLAIIETLATVRTEGAAERTRGHLRIREAAEAVGAEVTALRHWERKGLVAPRRDPANAYRLYSPRDVDQLRLIALLRDGGHSIPAVRDVVASLASGDIVAATRAAHQRLDQINVASLRCAAATAALWGQYAKERQEPA